MSERVFPFVQFEFPWELGPADGRYVLREHAGGEPQRVLVLSTVGAARRGRRTASRRRRSAADSQPASIAVARATVIDATAGAELLDETRARAWLDGLDTQAAVADATAVLNDVLFAHRIAAADAYVRALSPAQALAIRAGWGTGEQVAHGEYSSARELPWSERRARRRASALRPQERFTRLIGAHEQPLICEELALRSRADLDEGRLAHAAIELAGAYAAALEELAREDRTDLDERLAELRRLRAGVELAAHDAMPRGTPGPEVGGPPDGNAVRHALERLEAALRARTAVGFAAERPSGT